MKISRVLGLVVALGMTSMAQATSLVIDTFSDTQTLSAQRGTTTIDTTAGSMLGGSRTVLADATAGTGSAFLDVAIGGASSTGSSLEVSNGFGVKGVVTLTWDSFGVGLGGIDITDGGIYNYLSVSVLGVDTSTTVEFILTDTLSMFHSVGPSAFAGAGSYNVLLSDFADNGVDVTSIDKVSMIVTGVAAWDGAFDLIEVVAVPAPAPIALLGLSLVGLGLMRRKIA